MATIKDVATRANTSPATVSRFINGTKVRKETEKKIISAIEELNYRVHMLGRGLKTNKTYTVAYVVPDLTNIHFAYIAKAAQRFFYEQGYSFMVLSTDYNPEREQEIVEFLMDKSVDGVMLSTVSKNTSKIEELDQNGIPIVLIDRMVQHLDADVVAVDNVNGTYEAIEVLIQHGHRKIGIINGPQDVLTGHERYKGYVRAFEDYGLPIDFNFVKFGDFELPSGYSLMMELLEQKERPSAVFICNYYMSIGAIIAMNEKNIKIPDEISYISFDDMELSGVYNPPLSTIAQPLDEIGLKASKLLMERIIGEKPREHTIYRLKTKLNLRSSVKNLCVVQSV